MQLENAFLLQERFQPIKFIDSSRVPMNLIFCVGTNVVFPLFSVSPKLSEKMEDEPDVMEYVMFRSAVN